MRATSLRLFHRVLVGVGYVILLLYVVFVGVSAARLGGLAFILFMYGGFSFVLWRVLRGRVLSKLDNDIASAKQRLDADSQQVGLSQKLLEDGRQARQNGQLVPCETMVSMAVELPDHESPLRSFIERINQDDAVARETLSAAYIDAVQQRLRELRGKIDEDPQVLPAELDKLRDNLIEQEIALSSIVQIRLDTIEQTNSPETRGELWQEVSNQIATLREFDDAGLALPDDHYPRYGDEYGYAANVLSEAGCRSESPAIEPQTYEACLSRLDETLGRPKDGDALRYAELAAQVKGQRARIEQAGELLDQGEAFESQERYRSITDTLQSIRDKASGHGFSSLTDTITELMEECREGQKRAFQTVSSGTAAGQQGVASNQTIERNDVSTQSPRGTVADSVQAQLPEHDVLEHLGTGGNAEVHKVRLTDSGRVAALKIPQWQGTLSRKVVEDFIEEAQTWARLDDHRHIIDIHEFGTDPHPWMLLEFMDHGNLATHLDSIRRVQGVSALIDVCNATHHAHQHGVAHTDLKPENIMFTADTDGKINVKVGDWGLAQVMLEHSRSVEGMTPSYAAPEQIDLDAYGSTGPATDVYQLGVLLFEILTREVPYEYDSAAAVMNAIVTKDPPMPSSVTDGLPPAVDDIVARAMATEKSDRYESVLYLRDALSNLQ